VKSLLGTMLDNRLLLSSDMNLDGAVTISDVLLWFKWLYFLPGDLAALVLLGTSVGDFFEVTQGSIGGIGSGILSFCFWFVIIQHLLPRGKS
jgi:hypothetical protein